MPFKKYQSLADSLTQNKRLSKRRRGRRWTPRSGFLAPGLHADFTQHAGWHVACFHARAVAGCGDCCLLEQTIIDFSIRMMPMWSGDRQRDRDVRCGLAVRESLTFGRDLLLWGWRLCGFGCIAFLISSATLVFQQQFL